MKREWAFFIWNAREVWEKDEFLLWYIFDIFGRDKIYQMLKTMGHLSWNGAFYLTIGTLQVLYILVKGIKLIRVNLVEIDKK